MTEIQQMQQPSENIDIMFPTDSSAGLSASTDHVETQRLDPHASLVDYNRIMLEYTQRQMASFVHFNDGSSRSSSNSGTSSIAHQANGPPSPTSAGAAAAVCDNVQQSHTAALSPNEANPSQC